MISRLFRNFGFSKGTKQTFIDNSKFVEGVYTVYKSTEGRSIKLINAVYVGFLAYNIFSYYRATLQDFNIGQRDNSRIMIGGLGVGMVFFNLKVARTLKHLHLDINGRYSYVEMYRKMGFSSSIVQLENRNFKSIGYFIHESFRIPQIRVVDPGTGNIMKVFFKQKYIIDQVIMKEILQGKSFSIASGDMQIHISDRRRKTFNL